jgi:multicomponent Na+:H+ antiporter subunit C
VILAVSLAVAAVFGLGTFLVLQRDLFRVVLGIVLISNSAFLFIIASGLTRGTQAGLGQGAVPVLPLPEGEPASDPLAQAMALTALVIGLSVAALLLSLAYRLYTSQGTVDLSEVSEAEVHEAEALEGEGEPEAKAEEELGERPQ